MKAKQNRTEQVLASALCLVTCYGQVFGQVFRDAGGYRSQSFPRWPRQVLGFATLAYSPFNYFTWLLATVFYRSDNVLGV